MLFRLVDKKLESFELNIYSEVEVISAANDWLKHYSKECINFLKQLLLKVYLRVI